MRTVEAQRRSSVSLLVEGEPGVGKTAVATMLVRRADEGSPATVLDAALEQLEGTARWLTELRAAVSRPGSTTVVRHLQCLPPGTAQAVCAVLDTLGPDARVIGTVTRQGQQEAHPPLLTRFAVTTITVPPLRERSEDVPELFAALLRRHSGSAHTLTPSEAALHALVRYDWPGNVAELDNLVRHLLATRMHGVVHPTDLPAEVAAAGSRRSLSPLERMELHAIQEALRSTHGNKIKAAEILGMSRATLYRRLRSHGLLHKSNL